MCIETDGARGKLVQELFTNCSGGIDAYSLHDSPVDILGYA